MRITEWSKKVNSRFFAFNDKPKDNTRATEYMSGRITTYAANTRYVMQFSCSLHLTKQELADFWQWFNDDLCGCAGAFTCGALGKGYYRFAEVPEPQDTNQQFRVLSMNIEEIY